MAELDYYVDTKKFWLSLLSLSDNWVILFFAGRPNFLTLARLRVSKFLSLVETESARQVIWCLFVTKHGTFCA